MKKLFLSLSFIAFSTCLFAQKQVTIKGGTPIPVISDRNIKAADVSVGQNIDFKVARDFFVDGIVAIPSGTIVKGQVYEAKRSTAFGTKGRLGIQLRYLNLPSGDVINFSSSNIYIQGQNRTAISVIVFCLTCLPFPCGSKAELKAGVEYEALVGSNTTVNVE
jgi:hypothetical protein